MAITRTPIHDDDGSGTTGTIIDNAWKQELYGQIDGLVTGGAAETLNIGTSQTVALSAAVMTHIFYLTPAANATIAVAWTGGSGSDGERVILIGSGAGVTTMAHGAAGGTIQNMVTSAPTPIATHGAATYLRISGAWFLTTYEQGLYVVPPFNAAHFVGSGSQTWTLQAADRTTFGYRLAGRQLTVNLELNTTTVGGTPSTDLQILNAAYGGFSAGPLTSYYGRLARAVDAGTGVQAVSVINSGGTMIRLLKETFAAWTLGTDTTSVAGPIVFEVG